VPFKSQFSLILFDKKTFRSVDFRQQRKKPNTLKDTLMAWLFRPEDKNIDIFLVRRDVTNNKLVLWNVNAYTALFFTLILARLSFLRIKIT
jgi:hypothetical protein